jgi:hypothetical protein
VEPAGFQLDKSPQSFEFGVVTGYEIVNYNDTYENYVKKFLNELTKNPLAEPYETLKSNFAKIQSTFPPNSLNFKKFKEAFNAAVCKKEITNAEEALKPIIAAEKKFKKATEEQKQAFESFNTSLKEFFTKFPQQVQENCENAEKHQAHVESKIKILDSFGMSC